MITNILNGFCVIKFHFFAGNIIKNLKKQPKKDHQYQKLEY